MSAKAKRGVITILKILWQLDDQSPKLFFKLFDGQIQPMLMYGAEVWGLMADHNRIEKVHLYALKRLLNVSIFTPNTLVYGETGRYPLYVTAYSRCIKYWLDILDMQDDRLPLKAYKMLLRLHNKNKSNWVSKISETLYQYGFGYVWENQGVRNKKAFIKAFKQRLIDCYLQNWHSTLFLSERYCFYSSFKQYHGMTSELFDVKPVVIRKALIQFRLGVSSIKSHRLRYRAIDLQNLSCPFCPGTIENEYHFLFICPEYNDIRKQLIPNMFFNQSEEYKMINLMANLKCMTTLAIYVYKAFQVRGKKVEELKQRK
jgi:hypothetical protein